MFRRLSRIPSVGDTVPVGTGTLRVAKMRGRRVDYVTFTPAARA